MKTSYTTMTEALLDLQERGFDFDVKHSGQHQTQPVITDWQIVETYRFEGNTDPADSAVIYALSSATQQLKGVLVDAYGTYGEAKWISLIGTGKLKN